jgi:cytochrome c556
MIQKSGVSKFMGDKSRTIRRLAVGCTAIVLAGAAAFSVDAQTAPPAGRRAIEAGRRAAEARKAIYTLIETYFAPLGYVVKGSTRYDEAEVQKRVVRVAFLANILSFNETYPDVSNLGRPDTNARPDVWANRQDFEKKLKDFQDHVASLVQVNATEKGATDAFKAAVNAVAQDCKGCHDSFRAE